MLTLIRFSSLFLLLTYLACAEVRTLLNSQGVELEASILSVQEDGVQVKRLSDGREFFIPYTSLSGEDQSYFKEQLTNPHTGSGDTSADESAAYSSDITAEQINAVLGMKLLGEGSWSKDTVDVVASRLSLNKESEVENEKTYRSYFLGGKSLVDAVAYTMNLLGKNNRPLLLSVVFANKGDFSPRTDDPAKELAENTRRDEKKISGALTDLLGEPARQSFGGGGSKERVDRWDWLDMSFLLAAEEGEYVTLRVMSRKMADAGGQPPRITAKEMKIRAEKNVTKRENGDVIISNIPMVDQGPKGYCVPATFERYMRYLQIPADMYMIAMSGETQIGGGTNMEKVMDGMKRSVSRYGRALKEMKSSLDERAVSRFIDAGLPLMWTMYSTETFNNLANTQTQKRANWDAWLTESRDLAREASSLPKIEDGHHILMIVGYNTRTGEIAVSDSWGPQFEERWILLEQAKAFDQGSFYYIDF